MRCLETEGNVPELDQTSFGNCMYAVTHATGHMVVQYLGVIGCICPGSQSVLHSWHRQTELPYALLHG